MLAVGKPLCTLRETEADNHLLGVEAAAVLDVGKRDKPLRRATSGTQLQPEIGRLLPRQACARHLNRRRPRGHDKERGRDQNPGYEVNKPTPVSQTAPGCLALAAHAVVVVPVEVKRVGRQHGEVLR